MPRASYGDRHCVSVLQGQTLATLDFTSRVIDFFTVQSAEAAEGGTFCWGGPTERVVVVGGGGSPLAAAISPLPRL